MNNKAQMSDLMGNILIFALIVSASIFGFLFIKNLYLEELIPPFESEIINSLELHGNDTGLYTTIKSQSTNYSNLDFKLDLLFLMIWLASTAIAIAGSFLLPPLQKLEFLSFLFIGVMVLLLFMNYLEQIFTWFVQEFITNIFDPSQTNLPIFMYYIDNYILINFLTVITMLLVNQLSLPSSTNKGIDVIEQDNGFDAIDEEPISPGEEEE